MYWCKGGLQYTCPSDKSTLAKTNIKVSSLGKINVSSYFKMLYLFLVICIITVLSIEKLELTVIKRKTVSKRKPDGQKTICVS